MRRLRRLKKAPTSSLPVSFSSLNISKVIRNPLITKKKRTPNPPSPVTYQSGPPETHFEWCRRTSRMQTARQPFSAGIFPLASDGKTGLIVRAARLPASSLQLEEVEPARIQAVLLDHRVLILRKHLHEAIAVLLDQLAEAA